MKAVVESFYTWYRSSIRNSKYRWLVILGSLTYLISPLDISPDIIPIVGWIDDGIVATILVTELSQLLVDYRKRRRNSVEPNPESSEIISEKVIEVEAK